jgi:hypothetical protein
VEVAGRARGVVGGEQHHPGTVGTAAQFAILRSWGVGLERFARATVAVSVSYRRAHHGGTWTLLQSGGPSWAAGRRGGQHAWAFGIAAVFLSAVSILSWWRSPAA